MNQSSVLPQWAPRVSRHRIAQLYAKDAKGIRDEELADDVGVALFARVESCLIATGSMRGEVTCPICGSIIHRDLKPRRRKDPIEILQCHTCEWQLSWPEYHSTYRKKRLGSYRLEVQFREFLEGFTEAQSYQQKMILIDTLLHIYHDELEGSLGGPGTANLIGGKMSDVAAFLNQLTYGDQSTPGLVDQLEEWRKLAQRAPYGTEDV